MKKAIAAILFLVSLILLFPIRNQIKDGGSVEYRAIIYTVYDVHKAMAPDYFNDSVKENDYVDGLIIEMFGIQVFNSTDPHINDIGDSPVTD